MRTLDFALQFVRYPKDIGSLVPSSPWLARKMVESIDFSDAKIVLEYGAGNGTITREILRKKTEKTALFAYEIDEVFRPSLEVLRGEKYFPRFEDIQRMANSISPGSVDVIFSSLPFGSFDAYTVRNILQDAKRILKPEGYFIQFQYFLQNKKDIEKYFTLERINWEIRNIPPAGIYVARNSIY